MCREVIAWAMRRRRLFRVSGDSMRPTFEDGDLVLVDVDDTSLPAPGTLVVARHPQQAGRVLIKRVLSQGRDTVALGSDNPTAGVDSRHFGSVPRVDIIGPVTATLSWAGASTW